MASVLGILTGIGSLLSGAGAIGGLFKGKPEAPTAPKLPKAAKLVPAGPPPLPTGKDLAKKRPGTMGVPPPSLQMAGLSPLQQRTGIATGALFGSPMFRDQSAMDYYRNLALTQFVDPSGALSPYENILPVDKQYAESLYGPLRGDSTEAFFDALMRGTA